MSARSADTGPDWVALDAALDQALDMNESERDGFLASLDPALRAALDPLLRDALRADSFSSTYSAVFSASMVFELLKATLPPRSSSAWTRMTWHAL